MRYVKTFFKYLFCFGMSIVILMFILFAVVAFNTRGCVKYSGKFIERLYKEEIESLSRLAKEICNAGGFRGFGTVIKGGERYIGRGDIRFNIDYEKYNSPEILECWLEEIDSNNNGIRIEVKECKWLKMLSGYSLWDREITTYTAKIKNTDFYINVAEYRKKIFEKQDGSRVYLCILFDTNGIGLIKSGVLNYKKDRV